jgi:hypothetical protein
MRLTPPLLVIAVALAAGACGNGDGAPAANPDQPVSAPARHDDRVAIADPAVCRRLSRRLAGRRLEDAQSTARAARCVVRVVWQDGEHLLVTDDLSRSRINVHVESGRVTKVTGLF